MASTEYEIKITGSGTSANLAKKLRRIADDIEQGNHINAIDEKGEAEWEDSDLMTTISEA